MAVCRTARAREVMVGPVVPGCSRTAWSSSSSQVRTALSVAGLGARPSIGQRAFGELEAAYAGRVVEKTEKVDMTRAATSTRVVASFRVTCISLSPTLRGVGSGE
jgi:hypothetical protein